MQKTAACAARTLRSTPCTKILIGNRWIPSVSLSSSALSSPLTDHDNTSPLSSRLSQRLVSQQNSTRTLTNRAKKRIRKGEEKRSKINRLALNRKGSSKVQPEWTAVGAALTTLEESIARTNLLLHSLASSEAWARRTRSPRLSWDQKQAIEAEKKQSTPAEAVKALTTLLQELGEKQAAAAKLLSRLNGSSKPMPKMPKQNDSFQDVFDAAIGTITESRESGGGNGFETGWGKNELVTRQTQAMDSSVSFDTPNTLPPIKGTQRSIPDSPMETASGKLDPHKISLDSIARDPEHFVPVPTLKHGLDRVLFNPGVHWVQDPHSRVYNFPPELQTMPAFTSFAYDRVNTFITSSKDTELTNLARRHDKKFVGSTSSVSMILAHIYFLVGNWRELDLDILSGAFAHMPRDFSAGQKMPYTFFMRQNDSIAAFDSGSQSEDPLDQNILSYIGVMLEKFLTLPKDDFDALLRHSPEELAESASIPKREAYRYSMDRTQDARKSKSMVLRSQLDCADSRLPGTGVFDLKTRAAISVRRDMWNIEYVPLQEMDQRLFGSHEGGERVFKVCLGFLEIIAENMVSCFPGQDIKAMICTAESKDPELSIWVEPANWEDPSTAPVHEIRLKVSHQIKGETVPLGVQVSFEHDDWEINYNIVKVPPSAETRTRRDKAFARQQAIRVSCLPEGMTIEELSSRMKDGILEGYAPRTGDAEPFSSGAESPNEETLSPSLYEWNKRFRTQATPLVHSLRALSRKGLEDLEKWTQDASPKVVYKPRD
ncbi:hypothetical protein FRC11_001457 [Ceratobasidium sp. 423]|nr:hypothetical protein FRC11_001457 [Ceratobasidium sp. 423]